MPAWSRHCEGCKRRVGAGGCGTAEAFAIVLGRSMYVVTSPSDRKDGGGGCGGGRLVVFSSSTGWMNKAAVVSCVTTSAVSLEYFCTTLWARGRHHASSCPHRLQANLENIGRSRLALRTYACIAWARHFPWNNNVNTGQGKRRYIAK